MRKCVRVGLGEYLRIYSQCNAEFSGAQGARAQAPHHVHVFSHICDVCLPLVIFSEKRLFVEIY